MKRYLEIINIEKVTDVMDEGVTEPIHCIFNGNSVEVVKYPRNRFGPYVLINEWIGNRLGDEIDIEIPRYGICFLSEDVIRNSDCEEIGTDNSGLCF